MPKLAPFFVCLAEPVLSAPQRPLHWRSRLQDTIRRVGVRISETLQVRERQIDRLGLQDLSSHKPHRVVEVRV